VQESFVIWKSGYGQDYALYLPANPAGEPLPVVTYFHGAGPEANPCYRQFWIIDAVNKVEPCAVLLPRHPYSEADNGAAWGGTYNADLNSNMNDVLAELDTTILRHHLDASRQYLYGDSMGGEGVYLLLDKLPMQFAGAISVSGYTLNKNAKGMSRTALWMIYGGKDDIYCGEAGTVAQSSRAIYAAIVAAGGTHVKRTEYPNGDHMYAINNAAWEPGLFQWLLAQRKH
jgi:predicted peptidase